MPSFVCVTCGTKYPDVPSAPAECPICLDPRQYVGWGGQQWTTMPQLAADHHNMVFDEGPGLTGVRTEPKFAIGQRALHVAATDFPLLWDCVTLVDDAGVDAIRQRSGARAIAISHPHYYSGMVAWSHALGGVPVYLHAADSEWVMNPDPALRFWEGETLELAPGVTLIRCGGHFDGGTVLHWAGGAGGAGALLAGDILQVGQDRRTVSVMYSYPNAIPVGAETIRRVARAVAPFTFDQLYGAWPGQNIIGGADEAVKQSLRRYIEAIEGAH